MTKLRINKLDAARRQIDAAIRLTFSGEDPVAIHTVISAANRIVRDLCSRRGDIESYLRVTDWIRPGHEAEFWRHWNASANFLKHAEVDKDAIHDFEDEASDFLIVFTAKWYQDLGNELSVEMRTFAGWWTFQNPEMLKPGVVEVEGVSKDYAAMVAAMTPLNRQDRLKAGALMLRQAKATEPAN